MEESCLFPGSWSLVSERTGFQITCAIMRTINLLLVLKAKDLTTQHLLTDSLFLQSGCRHVEQIAPWVGNIWGCWLQPLAFIVVNMASSWRVVPSSSAHIRLTSASETVARQLESTNRLAEEAARAQNATLHSQEQILRDGELLRQTLHDSSQGIVASWRGWWFLSNRNGYSSSKGP